MELEHEADIGTREEMRGASEADRNE